MVDNGYNTPRACVRAGMYWFGRRNYDSARAWWQRALNLDPDDAKAKKYLGMLEDLSSDAQESAEVEELALSTADIEADVEMNGPPPAVPDIHIDEAPGFLPARLSGSYHGAAGAAAVEELPVMEINAPTSDDEEEDEDTFVGAARSGAAVPMVMAPAHSEEDEKEDTTISGWDRHDDWSEKVVVSEIQSLDIDIDLDPVTDFSTGDVTQATMPGRALSSTGLRVPVILDTARKKFQLDDFEGTLDSVAELPDEYHDDEDIRVMRETCEERLTTIYTSKLGDLRAVPRVLAKESEIAWLNMDHRAGFLFSQVDGSTSMEDLIAVSGLDNLDALRILVKLLEQDAISTASEEVSP